MDLGDIAKGVKNAAPKLEDVAKDAMAWVTQADKRTKAHETYLSRIKDLRNEISDAFFVEDASGGDFEKLRGIYRSDLSKMAKNLELPKTLKTSISEEAHYLDQAGSPYEANFDMHTILSDYHNRIAKLPPNEKKQFDTLVDLYKGGPFPVGGSLDFASGA